MEAWGLGTFMISAGVFTTLLESPGSPVREAIPDGGVRLALVGIAMGLTAVGTIYSPWGKRSGAHINPARTFASAAPAGQLGFLWLYFTAPVLGMMAAVESFRIAKQAQGWLCAKLNRDDEYRCIHCGHKPARTHYAADHEISSLQNGKATARGRTS